MKNLTGSLLFVFALLMAAPTVHAQEFKGLDKSPLDVASYPASNRETNKKIKVYYSRPQLNGRDMAKLAPNDKVWRTGANESTEIVLSEDMKMGGQMVKAGTYSLFTIPGEKEWTIILNSDTNGWGSYAYNEANNVASVKVPVTMGDKSIEAFSIVFDDNGTMHMGWDKARVAVPFTK